jgi:hypothetical protein
VLDELRGHQLVDQVDVPADQCVVDESTVVGWSSPTHPPSSRPVPRLARGAAASFFWILLEVPIQEAAFGLAQLVYSQQVDRPGP